MATITAQYLGNLKVDCVHEQSGARIVTDAPTDNGGQGEAFSPTDLCAAALAACAMTIMGKYAETHDLNITGTAMSVNKTMAQHPRRIGAIEVVFTMPDREYSEHHKQGLERAALTCPVHQSLHPDMERKLTFEWAR